MNPARRPLNLGAVLQAGSDPQVAALIDLSQPNQPRQWTYGELDALCDAVANGLRVAGIGPGQRVGLVCQNSARAVAVLLGALRAGCVAVPLNPRAGAETLAFMFEDADLAIVFIDASAEPYAPGSYRSVRIDAPEFERFAMPGRFQTTEAGADDPAFILYTSGSTGRPKGVLLSHASQLLIAAGYATPALAQCLAAGPTIVAAPIFHMNATANVTLAFLMGGTIVLLARFDARLFIDAIVRYRVSVISGVPTMTAMIAQETEALAQADLSSVKLLVIGSAPLSSTVLAQAQRLFPGAPVINSYGTTETGAGYFGGHPEDKPRPPMSVGYPLPPTRMRLVGDGAPDEGVLEIHAPTRMSAYLNRPELTAEKMQDGWINTGDIMRRDADGWHYFIGRADDMFVCSGENIYPGAVERLLERHPDVLEVCIVPLPDTVRGEVPVAFVVARPGSAPDERALQAHVIEHAAPYMHPRRVWFIDRMPLAGTNKIDRHALKARARVEADSR